MGDINHDGRVDISDLTLLARNYNTRDPNINPPAQQATIGLSTFALAAAIPLALLEIRRKAQKKPKA